MQLRFVMLTLFLAGPALAWDVQISAVATSGTPVPDHPSEVFGVFSLDSGPAIDGDTIAFNRLGGGIYKSTEGTIKLVTASSGVQPVVRGTRVYFLEGNDLFVEDNGAITHLAGPATSVPGETNTQVFTSTLAVDESNVVLTTARGIYLSTSTGIVTLATTDTPVPGGIGTLNGFTNPCIDGRTVAFIAYDGNGAPGIYQARDGQLETLVDASTPIPGSGGTPFFFLKSIVLRNEGLAFEGMDFSPFLYQGIYRLYQGALTAVANQYTPLPDGSGNFARTIAPAFDGGNVAFISGYGIYAWVGDQMVPIATTATPFGGSTFSTFFLSPMGVSGNSIAFGGVLANGVHGIFRADLVPGNAEPVSADYDGDGESELAYYDPDSATWFTDTPDGKFKSRTFGYPGVLPAAGDYDNDGVTDVSVYDPYNGYWYLLMSHNGFHASEFGYNGTLPVSADYDGDGATDRAVYDPISGWWFILGTAGEFRSLQFGYNGVKPVPADFDGDSKADIAVYDPAYGLWYILASTDGFSITQFGYPGVTPVTSDFDGQGADLAVFDNRDGNWYSLGQVDGFQLRQFGYNGVRPVTSDYDGDAKSDLGVYDPNRATWYLLRTSAGFHHHGGL